MTEFLHGGVSKSSRKLFANGLKSNHSSDQDPKGLNVQLEAGILSVNDPKFDQRDKSLNTDLE